MTFKFSKLGNHGVDIALHHMTSNDTVFWSTRKNSFVLVEDDRGDFVVQGKRCTIYSINGRGEIRWDVRAHDLTIMSASWFKADNGDGNQEALTYFGAKLFVEAA